MLLRENSAVGLLVCGNRGVWGPRASVRGDLGSRTHSPGLLRVPGVQDAGKAPCPHGAFFGTVAKHRTGAGV